MATVLVDYGKENRGQSGYDGVIYRIRADHG